MEPRKATIIRSGDKKGTQTNYSRYIFHLPSYPVNQCMGFFEGQFENTSMKYVLHYHKKMTEIFTVIQGEVYFILGNEEYVFQPGDTAIIPPLVTHGFKPKLPGSKLQFIFTDIDDREDFFNGLAKIVNGETVLNDEALEAFYNKHDQYTVKRAS